MVNAIAKAILANEVETNEEVLALEVEGQKVEDLIIAKTSKIGEKLSFRRFTKVAKSDNEKVEKQFKMEPKVSQ